ncbi:MAG: DUF6498-containing protein [Leptospirales bacterium]
MKLSKSLAILLISNMVPLAGVAWLGWSAATILLIYWAENAIIGIYNIAKMLRAGFTFKKHESAVLKITGAIFMSLFFVVHYSMFMGGHLVFLIVLLKVDTDTVFDIFKSGNIEAIFFQTGMAALLALFASHGYSFYYNFLKKKEYRNKTAEDFLGHPYPRMIIMHMAILASAFFVIDNKDESAQIPMLLILIILKIAIDGISHVREHKNKKNRKKQKKKHER